MSAKTAKNTVAPYTSTPISEEEAALSPDAEAYLTKLADDIKDQGLWAKIAWVQTHIGQVDKTGQMAHGNVRYSFMQEHGLIGVLRPLQRIAGLAVVGGLMAPEHFQVNGNQTIVMYSLTVADVVDGEQVTRYYPNVGNDNSDKGFGKAYTGAQKYALQKFFLIPTDAIDDNDAVIDTRTAGTNDVGATVRAIASSKPSSEEVDELRQLLLKEGEKGNERLTGAKIRNRLTAEYAVATLDELTKSQFKAFGDWVLEQIVAAP